jgi:hypothetical protein
MDKGVERARNALQSKQIELKEKGLRNKPNAYKLLLAKMKSNCFTGKNFLELLVAKLC